MRPPCPVCGKPATKRSSMTPVASGVTVHVDGTAVCAVHSRSWQAYFESFKGSLRPSTPDELLKLFAGWVPLAKRKLEAKRDADPRGTPAGLRAKSGTLVGRIRKMQPGRGAEVAALGAIKREADALAKSNPLGLDAEHARFLRMEELARAALLLSNVYLPEVDWRPTQTIPEDAYALPGGAP